MRIRLYLVDEDQSVVLLLHKIPGQKTDLKVKILHRPDVREQAAPLRVLDHIDLYEVVEQFLSDLPDNEGLADLSCPVDQQNFPAAGLQMGLDQRSDLSEKHVATSA